MGIAPYVASKVIWQKLNLLRLQKLMQEEKSPTFAVAGLAPIAEVLLRMTLIKLFKKPTVPAANYTGCYNLKRSWLGEKNEAGADQLACLLTRFGWNDEEFLRQVEIGRVIQSDEQDKQLRTVLML